MLWEREKKENENEKRGGKEKATFGHRDGNGGPVPVSPRGIHPLGDEDGKCFFPTGILSWKKFPPSGMAGTGLGKQGPPIWLPEGK